MSELPETAVRLRATAAASVVGTDSVQEGWPVGQPETTTLVHRPWPRALPEQAVPEPERVSQMRSGVMGWKRPAGDEPEAVAKYPCTSTATLMEPSEL